MTHNLKDYAKNNDESSFVKNVKNFWIKELEEIAVLNTSCAEFSGSFYYVNKKNQAAYLCSHGMLTILAKNKSASMTIYSAMISHICTKLTLLDPVKVLSIARNTCLSKLNIKQYAQLISAITNNESLSATQQKILLEYYSTENFVTKYSGVFTRDIKRLSISNFLPCCHAFKIADLTTALKKSVPEQAADIVMQYKKYTSESTDEYIDAHIPVKNLSKIVIEYIQ